MVRTGLLVVSQAIPEFLEHLAYLVYQAYLQLLVGLVVQANSIHHTDHHLRYYWHQRRTLLGEQSCLQHYFAASFSSC